MVVQAEEVIMHNTTISGDTTIQDFFKESAKKYNVKEGKKIARKVRNKTPLVAQFMAACARFNIPSEVTISKSLRDNIVLPVKDVKLKSNLTEEPGAYKIARAELGAGSRYAKVVGFAFLKYKGGNMSISQLQSEAMLSDEDLFHFTSLL